MLRTLKSYGMPPGELMNIYKMFILPKLSYASPVWSSSLTITQLRRLERVQKRALRISLAPNYTSYDNALTDANLPKLSDTYADCLSKFANKLLNHPRYRSFLPPDLPAPPNSTRHRNELEPIRARTERYKKSPIPAMVKLLNES